MMTDAQLRWIHDVFGVDAAPSGPGGGGNDAPGAPPASPVDQQKSTIASGFGVSFGAGPVAWKADEVTAVAQGFSAIPAADRSALAGIEVDRVPMIGTDPDTAGNFETATDSTPPAKQVRKLMLADSAFGGGPANRGLAVPPAERKRKVIHEVGHVVAHKGQNDADLEKAKSIAAFNQAVAARDQVLPDFNATQTALNDAYKSLADLDSVKPKTQAERDDKKQRKADLEATVKTQEALASKLGQQLAPLRAAVTAAEADMKAAGVKSAATRVAPAVVASGQAQVDSAGTAADTAASSASGAGTGSAQDKAGSAAYRQASAVAGARLKAYADAIKAGQVGRGPGQTKPDDLDAGVLTAIKDRNTARQALAAKSARNPALAAYAGSDQAQAAWCQALRTQSRLADRTPKIQEFVDLVTANRVAPFTPYAAQNWPFKPEEFFAEAYALWVTDPVGLRSKAPSLADWFDAGKYR